MIVLVALVGLGLGLALALALAQRAVLKAPSPPEPEVWPRVSILKPLRGIDPALEANLRTFFELDYPAYELVFGAEDPFDPALDVARKLAAEYPRIRSIVTAGDAALGWNPKVNNLANIVRHASHEVLLISDSNVAAPKRYVRELVAHLEQPGVGLVSSLFRGSDAAGLGGTLEALQLNTFVQAGVAGVYKIAGLPCVVGKSMMMRRADLARIGGFGYLAEYLAEDQVCGEEMHAAGRRVRLSGLPIDNVLGRRSVREFVERHLRWARIRRRINAGGYAGELLLNPFFVGVVGAVILRTPESLALAASGLAGMSVIAAVTERRLGIRRRLLVYPVLEFLRSVITGVTWIVPFFTSTTNWRGHRLRIGPRTKLEPVETPEAEALRT